MPVIYYILNLNHGLMFSTFNYYNKARYFSMNSLAVQVESILVQFICFRCLLKFGNGTGLTCLQSSCSILGLLSIAYLEVFMHRLSSLSFPHEVVDVICRSYTKSNHADHECQGSDSVSFEESSSGLFNSLNHALPSLSYEPKMKPFFLNCRNTGLVSNLGKMLVKDAKMV